MYSRRWPLRADRFVAESTRVLVHVVLEFLAAGDSPADEASTAEIARTRDVLHAAVDLALEDDDATRVALLSLIPRRKDARKQQQKPPVQLPMTGTK